MTSWNAGAISDSRVYVREAAAGFGESQEVGSIELSWSSWRIRERDREKQEVGAPLRFLGKPYNQTFVILCHFIDLFIHCLSHWTNAYSEPILFQALGWESKKEE